MVTDLKSQDFDFVIKRKDNLFAYQLAVVVDDALQNITEIIRGVDLIDSTPIQIYLQQALKFPTPNYGHVLLIMNDQGQKLSKRAHSSQIDNKRSGENLYIALKHLQQNPPEPLRHSSNNEILSWAVDHWQPQLLEGKAETLADPRFF